MLMHSSIIPGPINGEFACVGCGECCLILYFRYVPMLVKMRPVIAQKAAIARRMWNIFPLPFLYVNISTFYTHGKGQRRCGYGGIKKSRWSDLNRRPPIYETGALPTELHRLVVEVLYAFNETDYTHKPDRCQAFFFTIQGLQKNCDQARNALYWEKMGSGDGSL